MSQLRNLKIEELSEARLEEVLLQNGIGGKPVIGWSNSHTLRWALNHSIKRRLNDGATSPVFLVTWEDWADFPVGAVVGGHVFTKAKVGENKEDMIISYGERIGRFFWLKRERWVGSSNKYAMLAVLRIDQ